MLRIAIPSCLIRFTFLIYHRITYPKSTALKRSMKTLISKLQYKNYEKGEFNNIEMRTVEETIQLIKDYPWEEQRQLASVELTCPSVTIEHDSGQFLKLGPHFGGKFCLYLSNGRKISEKIIQHLEDSFEVITNFYNDKDISKGFDRLFLVFWPKSHFVTASFQYSCTPENIVESFFNFLAGSEQPKDLHLNLSRGHNNFYFGTEDDYREYFKTDIISINLYKNLYNRRGSQYAIYEIRFKNGEQIRFPNQLLSETLFYKKFIGQNINRIHQRDPVL